MGIKNGKQTINETRSSGSITRVHRGIAHIKKLFENAFIRREANFSIWIRHARKEFKDFVDFMRPECGDAAYFR